MWEISSLAIGRFVMAAMIGLGLFFVWVDTGTASAEETEIYVTDALTIPSKPVQLQARLIQRSPEGETGLPQATLEFFVQGRPIGQGTTDEEGWARLPFTPKMRGNLNLRVKRVTGAKQEAIEGKGVLLSWERRRPLLLIDLAVVVEGELETEPPPPDQFEDPGLILGDPLAAAPVELGKLAQFYYNLVYLDLTGRGQSEYIQVWLRQHHFPPGMIKILPQASTALSDALQDLRDEGWEKLSGGIGRTVQFAEVLVKNRLQTVILPKPDTTESFPVRAIVLNDWSRVRRHL